VLCGMGMPQEAESFEFAGYLGVLRRRWWVVLVLACVGVVAAGAYIAVSPKGYTATSTVNVTATGSSQTQSGGAVAGGRTSSAVNLDTEVQIVQSSSVAAIAAHDLRSSLTPAALVNNITVVVPANSSVLQIGCTARSAQQSAACANAFAAAYLANRSATAARTNSAQANTIKSQLNVLEKRTAQLTIQSRSLPVNSPQRASAQAQLQTTASQLRALANQSAALSASGAAASGGSIITKATPPAKPSSPKKTIILPSGLLAGLLIGLLIAFAWDKRDTRVTNPRSLGQLGVPMLLSLSAKDLDREPLAAPRSPAGQDFGGLARSTTAALGEDHQLVLVAGASPGAAASVAAANLAVAMTRTHSAVILVCPSGQGTTGLLGVPESRRLDARAAAELAAGQLSVEEVALQPAGFPRLRVVVLGEDLHDLTHAQARILAEQLRDALAARHAVAGEAISARACPLDLHMLVPMPDDLLGLGPDDPRAIAWLWAQWGTTWPLRHVTVRPAGAAVRRRLTDGHGSVMFRFHAADWSPWPALLAMRARWPALRFDLQPDYGPEPGSRPMPPPPEREVPD